MAQIHASKDPQTWGIKNSYLGFATYLGWSLPITSTIKGFVLTTGFYLYEENLLWWRIRRAEATKSLYFSFKGATYQTQSGIPMETQYRILALSRQLGPTKNNQATSLHLFSILQSATNKKWLFCYRCCSGQVGQLLASGARGPIMGKWGKWDTFKQVEQVGQVG